MKRSFLTALGLEKDVIDQIMQEHGATVETFKERHKETEDALKASLKEAQDALKNAPAPDTEGWEDKYKSAASALEDAKSGLADWQKKHADESAAHKATKDSYAAEKDSADTAALVRAALAADGANPKAVDLLLKAIDATAIKKKDGAIENWSDVSKPLREQYGDFFGEIKQQGAEVGSPPASTRGNAEPDFNFNFTPVRAIAQPTNTKG